MKHNNTEKIRNIYANNAGKAEFMKHIQEKDIFKTITKESIKITDYGNGVTPGYQTRIICALAKMANGNVFEFGTLGGCTAHNILNCISHKIYTLDITRLPLKTEVSDTRINYLIGNSVLYDYEPFIGDISFVFIDGGHDYATVENDTRWAFKMIKHKNPAVIIWHDYQDVTDGFDVVKFLDELSGYTPLNFIERSSLVFYQRGLDF